MRNSFLFIIVVPLPQFGHSSVHDKNGQIYGVRYEAVNAMLLNEFRKQHEVVLQQQKKIEALEVGQMDYAALAARLEALEKVVASK